MLLASTLVVLVSLPCLIIAQHIALMRVTETRNLARLPIQAEHIRFKYNPKKPNRVLNRRDTGTLSIINQVCMLTGAEVCLSLTRFQEWRWHLPGISINWDSSSAI